jgi:hypothetical protein
LVDPRDSDEELREAFEAMPSRQRLEKLLELIAPPAKGWVEP